MADLYIALEEANAKAMELEAERDALRAKLAAAKNLLARIHRDGGHHTEAVGLAQSVTDADGKVSEWLMATGERDYLAAHVERLRAVLVWLDRIGGLGLHVHARITAALAATPAQSLAELKAALLREVAKQMDPDGGCYEALMAEADRIAKEAANA